METRFLPFCLVWVVGVDGPAREEVDRMERGVEGESGRELGPACEEGVEKDEMGDEGASPGRDPG